MNLLTGDSRFFYLENIKDFVTFPTAWDSSLNTGLGQPQLSSLWITSYFNFTAFFTKLGLDWNLIQIIFWVIPAILLSFFSSFFLFKHLFKNKKYSILSGAIYSLNTYFLMILTGGQLGVALSYSIAPLVLNIFIKLINNSSNIKYQILGGLVLALQVLFDPRLSYITLFAIFIYFLFSFEKKQLLKKFISVFIVPLVVVGLVHSYWVFPLVLTKGSPIPSGFNSSEGFKFFSFSDFSHSLSLLHPNWPENIFGKVYFLDPKFLVLPIIAFSSLLFVRTMKQSNNRTIVFFSILALLGAFLAKGANPPFGEINIWIFQNIPGMSMFRDPTKFYVLIALSYSVLIPFSLYNISILIRSNIKNQISKIQSKYQIFNFSNLFLLFTIFYLLFLITPIFGQTKIQQVSQEYIQLKDFLNNQKTFSRTLWIPKWQKFGFFSNQHPAIGREELFKGDAVKQIEELKKENSEEELRSLGVKYIIVPYDSGGEIFLEDRKYDEDLYREAVAELREITWLKELTGFGKIQVFEVANPKDRFWSPSAPLRVNPSTNLRINYNFLSPTEYKVNIQNAKKGDILVFSEGFDKNWIAETASGIKYHVSSSKYDGLLNSFVLPERDYELKVYYAPQRYVEAGLLVSLATLLASLVLLLFGKRLKKW